MGHSDLLKIMALFERWQKMNDVSISSSLSLLELMTSSEMVVNHKICLIQSAVISIKIPLCGASKFGSKNGLNSGQREANLKNHLKEIAKLPPP